MGDPPASGPGTQKKAKRRSAKAGLAPGTLVYIGARKTDHIRLTLIQYRHGFFNQQEIKSVDEFLAIYTATEPGVITWLDIGGLHDVQIIEQIGKAFELHPLLLEDIVNTEQRPKREDYGSVLYLVVKMLCLDASRTSILAEQVSLVVSERLVLSFQENGTDVWGPIRDRLRTGKGRIAAAGTDYLLYSLVDAVVDNYFAVLEFMGEQLERIEDHLLAAPSPDILRDLHGLKREMLFVRRATWPLREVVSGLERGDSKLMTESTRLYMRDVYDHTVQVIDTLETLRETVAEMLDVYLSSMSNRMAAVMKVLTIITTIFMPLSFIASVYGMNFRHMPGLDSRWGYPLVLTVMGAIGLLMIFLFHKKRWF
ncbi:MAG TPA: magnesium/cobalt transporter CorA [Nitrospiraceae bacterium]|nr:magnesium/cobalt transporter CorA [Nitrospiraceae bacterium]